MRPPRHSSVSVYAHKTEVRTANFVAPWCWPSWKEFLLGLRTLASRLLGEGGLSAAKSSKGFIDAPLGFGPVMRGLIGMAKGSKGEAASKGVAAVAAVAVDHRS